MQRKYERTTITKYIKQEFTWTVDLFIPKIGNFVSATTQYQIIKKRKSSLIPAI